MKKIYHIGDDLFIAIAFTALVIGGITKLLGVKELFWGITSVSLIKLSVISLLFSIALSLYDLAYSRK